MSNEVSVATTEGHLSVNLRDRLLSVIGTESMVVDSDCPTHAYTLLCTSTKYPELPFVAVGVQLNDVCSFVQMPFMREGSRAFLPLLRTLRELLPKASAK
jgi:hypothetical protein